MILKISKEKYERQLMLNGINSADVARAAGIMPSTLSRAVNGKSDPKPGTVGKIARALNCAPADILEEVKEK